MCNHYQDYHIYCQTNIRLPFLTMPLLIIISVNYYFSESIQQIVINLQNSLQTKEVNLLLLACILLFFKAKRKIFESRNEYQVIFSRENLSRVQLIVFQVIVREPNCENCLDFISVASPCEKIIFASDGNYMTYTIRRFMLDMPNPGSFQNVGF